ncbi:MAG: hypothetical protein ACYC9Z_15925 [Casimicrobiaceae bacterium]
MNTALEGPKTGETSSSGKILDRARQYLSGRRGLIVLAVAIIGAGMAFNWAWLVAIGVAPVILALAPCAAMCALGLCMNKMGGKSCSTKSAADATQQQLEPANDRK